jgi:flagellar motor switch protein FliM
MEKMLDQDDIDSMFAAAREAAQERKVEESKVRSDLYNFTRAGQISDEEMKAITSVNDFFAMNLKHTVGSWLRTKFLVKLVSGEQLPYSEFLERLSDPTYTVSIRLEPLGALGLLEFDLALAAPIVDLLLGGVGATASIRDLTDIEEEILTSLVQLIIRELNVAWAAIGLRFEFEQRENAGTAARMMSLAEKTLCMIFEVTMPEVKGFLNFCLPAVVLNSILRQLTSERDRPRRQTPEHHARLRDLAGATSVGMVLQFTPMKLLARDLASLTPGKVLRLPLSRYETAELCVGGLPMARAHPVRSAEHRGAQIVNLIADQSGPHPVAAKSSALPN